MRAGREIRLRAFLRQSLQFPSETQPSNEQNVRKKLFFLKQIDTAIIQFVNFFGRLFSKKNFVENPAETVKSLKNNGKISLYKHSFTRVINSFNRVFHNFV